MLQCRKNSTLNHTEHRFVAHSTRNYGHRSSFARFHLAAVSQCDHHASVQIDGQVVLFDQLRGNKAMAGTAVHCSPKLPSCFTAASLTSPLCNRVVSSDPALVGVLHEHHKKCNFFTCRRGFSTYHNRYRKQSNA